MNVWNELLKEKAKHPIGSKIEFTWMTLDTDNAIETLTGVIVGYEPIAIYKEGLRGGHTFLCHSILAECLFESRKDTRIDPVIKIHPTNLKFI